MKALLVLALLLLAGCAALRPPESDAGRLDALVAEVVRARASAPAAQRRELASAREAFAAEHGELDRLRLATLLATLPAPLGDDAQAAALLAPLAARAPATPVTRFASLLASQIAARRRLERAERGRSQALRESRERELELQRKLNELKSIERSALSREERLRFE